MGVPINHKVKLLPQPRPLANQECMLFAMAKAGRPRKTFDARQVQAFGRMGLTGMEMAAALDTTNVTISHRMTEGSEFFKAYQLGFSDLKKSLRRAQIKSALRGNPSMLIWLGKQLLGQTEGPSTQVNVAQYAGSNPLPNVAEYGKRLADARRYLREHQAEFEKPPNSRLESNGA